MDDILTRRLTLRLMTQRFLETSLEGDVNTAQAQLEVEILR
jgi:hypothetical protein